MSSFFRMNRHCSELDRTPDEMIAFAAIPHKLRKLRYATHAPDTAQRYVDACGRFAVYNRSAGRPSLVNKPQRAAAVVLDYLRHRHEDEGAPAMAVRNERTAINTWYISRGLDRPSSRPLAAFIRSLYKGRITVRATPVTPAQVKAMVRHAFATKSPLRAARDRSLITHAFSTAERPIEVRHFRTEHREKSPDGRGHRILIPISKGDQEGEGQWVTVTPAREKLYDPIAALDDWLAMSGIESGYVYRRIDKAGNLGPDEPLSYAAYRYILDEYLAAAGVTGKRSGYSMRRGWATSARRYGASRGEIRDQLRHKKDETSEIYIDGVPMPFERSITGVLLS